MPTRMIDYDALWASDKLARCAAWAQAEYAWLYGLADANGAFETTNLRVIWGKVAAIRKNLSIERLEQIFDEFHDKGLLFIWERDGKRYAYWTGCDRAGRLPPKSLRHRYSRFVPTVPEKQLKAYLDGIKTASRVHPYRIEIGLNLDRENHCANPSGSHDAVLTSIQANPTDSDVPAESAQPEQAYDPLGTNDPVEAFSKLCELALSRVWPYYLEKLGKNPKLLSFTPLRKQKGLARLKECLAKTGGDLTKAEELLKLAVDALAASAFHRGENERKRRYDSWEKNLFHSQEQLERWLEQA